MEIKNRLSPVTIPGRIPAFMSLATFTFSSAYVPEISTNAQMAVSYALFSEHPARKDTIAASSAIRIGAEKSRIRFISYSLIFTAGYHVGKLYRDDDIGVIKVDDNLDE